MGNATVSFIPNPHPEVMGKKVKVKFMVQDLKKEGWFFGVITTYNGEYGIFFPSDNQTVEMTLDDEDLDDYRYYIAPQYVHETNI